MTKTEDSSSSSTAPISQPKCPISGQEAKNGETCAYDPTKMSFWTSKPAAAKAKSVEQQVVSESESCPMRSKTDTTVPLSQPKCPISGQEAKNGETCAYDPTKMSFWTSKPAAAKAKPVEQQVVSEPESCPMRAKSDTSSSADKYKNPNQYNVYSQKIDTTNNMPAAANQSPAPNQSSVLDTTRVKSTIPKAGSDDGSWVYPSPQMFWNALVRKGKTDGASEEDMDTVIGIHNNMNETTWKQVISWENLQSQSTESDKAPKLLRFMGRPDELSPMARLKMIFNHPAPFDRHDWVVDRGGQEVRYIIDYYHDESSVEKDQNPKHLHDITSMRSIAVDVRPALDSVEALFARFVMMPFASLRGATLYNPPPFFPTRQMTVAEEHKDARIARNWADIISKCAVNKDALAACDSEESCGAASVALQRCMSSVVCPSVSLEFDKCVAATPQNDSLTGAAFNAMIKCIEIFEMDSKQIHQQKKLAAGK